MVRRQRLNVWDHHDCHQIRGKHCINANLFRQEIQALPVCSVFDVLPRQFLEAYPSRFLVCYFYGFSLSRTTLLDSSWPFRGCILRMIGPCYLSCLGRIYSSGLYAPTATILSFLNRHRTLHFELASCSLEGLTRRKFFHPLVS